ncbi:hypothetical protein [[Flexibacter] sp. ATCC 35103]|uniref:hypothetical protein n=1 Tax=[Flexibacter] sp. ATCC 35103 TaxID=1937528 RepID=UPI0009CCFBA7|nr:hypothetical protein [[Flexibacter] sp. ATCC 35103]OMQ11160.1 hypothetical protein BXU01_12585 [[Flexibacter] sp. ATCC 35103]
MIKKLLLLSVVLSQFAISCSSDDSTDPTTDPVTEEPTKDKTLAEQIAEIVKQPYSKLTPAEQKIKLEAEANDMLVQLDKSKSSSAIEALENLSRLLDIYQIDIFSGKNDNNVEDILNISGVYGVYTWNNTAKKWDKTASTTELKFVFPAKKSQTANNAVLTSKGVSSDVKVKYYDGYNGNESVYDNIFLPSSSDAALTVDNAQVATFTQTAKYSSKNQSPDEFAYKMTLSDGYTWEMNGKKGTENISKALFTYNGKTLLDFNSGSSANIDALIDNDDLVQYRGKANGLIKLMDNFIIVADMNLETEGADKIALEKSLVRPTYPDSNNPKSNYKEYYTALNAYEKKYSEGSAANFNKNLKLILVSKKDGTKIADLVQHSEKSGNDYVFNLPVWNAQYSYWSNNGTGESFSQPYLEEVLYLKFNDNTEVSFSTYFSSGFEKFEAKFEDFINAFEK